MAVQIGTQLGDYRLVRELGSGTFGTVFQAEHIYIGTQVAIKVLHGQITDAERVKLRAEARNQAALEHAHIVQVLGYSEQPVPYLVMKFAPNGTLKDRYPQRQRYPLATILPHVRQIAEGLQHAHNQQTLHLDLKPANILLGKAQDAVISDFGIALILAEHRTHKTVGDFAGTPAYAAPEQFANKPGKASDQYALATMVYLWLTGRFPFEGDLVAIIGQKLSNDLPPPLRSHLPNLLPAVEQAVLRALARDPQARFTSVLEFVQALESAARPAAPTPVPTPAKPKKTKKQWNDEGDEHYKARRYEEALAAYEQALLLDPNDAYSWYNKGTALDDLERLEDALAAYEQALQLDPNFAYAWGNKGNTLTDLQRYDEALASYELALRLAPHNANDWNNKSLLLRRMKRYSEALQACERAINCNPTFGFAWRNKGDILKQLGLVPEAEQAYQKARELGYSW